VGDIIGNDFGPKKPIAETSDIKRRRQTMESFTVFKEDLALDARLSCPKPPEPYAGCKQLMKIILKNIQRNS
jgi:hypothetical protein